jgi:hypothetical protein
MDAWALISFLCLLVVEVVELRALPMHSVVYILLVSLHTHVITPALSNLSLLTSGYAASCHSAPVSGYA